MDYKSVLAIGLFVVLWLSICWWRDKKIGEYLWLYRALTCLLVFTLCAGLVFLSLTAKAKLLELDISLFSNALDILAQVALLVAFVSAVLFVITPFKSQPSR